MYYHILTVKLFFAYLVSSSPKLSDEKYFSENSLKMVDISNANVLVDSHNEEKGIISC